MPPVLTAVSLFSGAGGLDLGLKRAGFEFLLHVEHDEDSCETLRRNGFDGVVCNDVDVSQLARRLKSRKPDLLVGGPPCQPFSKSSQWNSAGAKGFEDERASTIDDYISAVSALRPRAFLLENVPQFQKMGGVDRIVENLDTSFGGEYNVVAQLLNASSFGVAQNRIRIFVVGLLDGTEFKFPKGNFGEDGSPLRSTWDYLCGLRPPVSAQLKGKWTPLLPSIPAGANYLHHTKRGEGLALFGWRTRFWSFLYKLDPSGVSPTIVANPSQNNGPFHWENRELTERELASIQSFPRSYKFIGDRQSVRRQIGNAVPPLLAEHLGRALARSLGRSPARRISLLPPRTKTPPVLPKLQGVPKAFTKMIGEHPDHPGTGLGPKPRV